MAMNQARIGLLVAAMIVAAPSYAFAQKGKPAKPAATKPTKAAPAEAATSSATKPADAAPAAAAEMDADGANRRTVAAFNGGQGSINVPCWAPDGSAFAYVRYGAE